jgi:hypothetical protein
MGSACSTDEETRHHRENRKNRSNPTESYDTWQQKMLLDIGVDPLAVVRDFPRMIVYVGTETHHNYLPAGCNNTNNNNHANEVGNAAVVPSRKPSENPLAPSTCTPHKAESEKKIAAAETSNETPPHDQHHHHHHLQRTHPLKNESDQGRPPLWIDTAGGGEANNSHTGMSPGPSPPQAPRLYPGGRVSQREPFRDDDAFSARMKRVREEVMLLSELCGERGTFGAAFEAAWDRLVAQGTTNTDAAAESEAASEYLAALQPQQQQQQQQQQPQDGRPPALAMAKRSGRHSLPLDVHQVLLNACVDSGMIALSEEPGHIVPTSTTPRATGASTSTTAAAVGGGAPPPPTRAYPFGVSRNSRPESAANSAFQLPETTAATGLMSEEAPADYGASGSATEKREKGKPHHLREQHGGGATTTGVKSSSNSQIRGAASLVTSGTPGMAAGAASRYVVRSATFHLMQFATQGVMFFPVQRLKHVLWVPWSSNMQDVSWTIHFSLKDATAADLIALKQHTLNALYNNASTVLISETNAAETAGLAEADPQHTTSAAFGSNRTSLAADQTVEAFGAMATTSAVSDADVRAAATSGTNAPARNTTLNNTNNSISRQQSEFAEQSGGKRKIIVIQHVQTGRHYVEDADRKTVPRYELDWACSIRVDQETLQETFAAFQHLAMQSSTKASPLLGHNANSVPPSLTRRALKSDDDGNAADQAAPPRDELEGDVSESGSAVAAAGVEGIFASQQPALLQREVVAATVEVVAARVERPPHTMCMVSSTWKKRKEELDYVLEQQYHVHLEDTDALHQKRIY